MRKAKLASAEPIAEMPASIVDILAVSTSPFNVALLNTERGRRLRGLLN